MLKEAVSSNPSKIAIIVGTRPQIIKSAPVIQEALRRNLALDIIHTGQHYDYELSQIFIKEFNLPEPTVNLNVGSGSHVYQIKEIMLKLEKYLLESKPSIVLIPSDTNSALAGALTAVKLDLSVAHIEAGARCYDMHMAEEINRRLIDHCSGILFAPTRNCKANLERESVLGSIYQTGDTMYDVFLRFRGHADKSDILSRLELSDKEYGLLTLHRAENVDNAERALVVKKPMKLIFGDRATYSFSGKELPIEELAVKSAKNWFKNNLRFVDPDKHVSYEVQIGRSAPNLADIFKRGGEFLGANDTSRARS
jgi:UDP-N-acetylglucosamine 2-epimerase